MALDDPPDAQVQDGSPSSEAAPTPSLTGRLSNAVLVMTVLTILASATNYASNLAFSRLLEPARFGDLVALLALTVVIAVPVGAAQTLIAERVAVLVAADDRAAIGWFIRHAFAHAQTLALLCGGLYATSIPIVVGALDLEGTGPAIAMVPLLFTSCLVPIVLGVIQGLDRFAALGTLLLTGSVLRIALGVPLVAWTGGAGGALIGLAMSNAIVVVVGGWTLRGYLIRSGTGAATSGLRRRPNLSTIYAGAAFVAFALLSNLDIVMAKLYLPRDDVGLYAALSSLGKVILFLPAAVAVVMVPNAARARHSGGASGQVLRLAAVLVAGTTAIAAVPAAIAPVWVLSTMFGDKYAAAEPGVLPIIAAGAGLALLYLVVVYSVVVRDRRWVGLLLAGVVAQLVGFAAFHDSPQQVATVQAVVVLSLLVVNEVAFHSLVRRGRSPAAP